GVITPALSNASSSAHTFSCRLRMAWVASCKASAVLLRPFIGASQRFPHRARAAFAAICDRLRGPSAAALAAPPFRPPKRPRATAWGFLDGSTGFASVGLYLGACPVDSSMIWYASWLGSRGRFFDRSGILQYQHMRCVNVQL